MANLALFDVDGVLANDDHRVHYALDKKWFEYFKPERVGADPLLMPGFDLLSDLIDEGWHHEFLTGRRDTLRRTTEDWMDGYKIPSGRMTMRTTAQTMRLAEFKVGYIGPIVSSGNYDRVVLFDDDPEVVRLTQETFGEEYAVHCTWYKKRSAMVKKAVA
jgi:hypothetical protein